MRRFSPLFVGEVLVGKAGPRRRAHSAGFSPLFVGEVLVGVSLREGFASAFGVSVPSSSGKFSSVFADYRDEQKKEGFSPLFVGEVLVGNRAMRAGWPSRRFSPLFVGEVLVGGRGRRCRRGSHQFQSPLRRGSSRRMSSASRCLRRITVSVPSSSGKFSSGHDGAYRFMAGPRTFQSPLRRGSSRRGAGHDGRCRFLIVSVPSSSGKFSSVTIASSATR